MMLILHESSIHQGRRPDYKNTLAHLGTDSIGHVVGYDVNNEYVKDILHQNADACIASVRLTAVIIPLVLPS